MNFESVIADLKFLADSKKAAQMSRFFKTGKGQYAEGDIFWGISNPDLHAMAKQYRTLAPEDLQTLLGHSVHEARALALFIMVLQYQKGSIKDRRFLVEMYLNNLTNINNWDLVDCSARAILGHFLFDKDREILYTLAQSSHLWSNRVAMIATLYFIRQKDFNDTLKLTEGFLNHPHDLMHKACGWMLREVGKMNLSVLEDFLEQYAPQMPRTMLRYAIEKLPEIQRQYFLSLDKNH
jgi:3-methyladenine DNA glycosylase AlkD